MKILIERTTMPRAWTMWDLEVDFLPAYYKGWSLKEVRKILGRRKEERVVRSWQSSEEICERKGRRLDWEAGQDSIALRGPEDPSGGMGLSLQIDSSADERVQSLAEAYTCSSMSIKRTSFIEWKFNKICPSNLSYQLILKPNWLPFIILAELQIYRYIREAEKERERRLIEIYLPTWLVPGGWQVPHLRRFPPPHSGERVQGKHSPRTNRGWISTPKAKLTTVRHRPTGQTRASGLYVLFPKLKRRTKFDAWMRTIPRLHFLVSYASLITR